MSVVAVYSMKGGVGKTTTAVNLSHLAAAAGQRTLLWDLDAQAASSFAFRVRPRIAGFGRKSLESGETLAAAIKATDYDRLDLLPADFAYRKLDRLLEQVGNPARVMTAILDTLGRDYDVVFLDCPAGFSLLTEGVFAAADAVLVPTIPTVFSLRTLARLVKWSDRANARFEIAAFFSMVDRRKALHRRTCEWFAGHPEVFLRGHIPYASVVEEMAVRRTPLPVFAARDPATVAFAGIWSELQTRLRRRGQRAGGRDRWIAPLRAIESLIAQLDSAGSLRPGAKVETPAPVPAATSAFLAATAASEVQFVHTFDTDGRDLDRHGYTLELRECTGGLRVVAEQAARRGPEHGAPERAQVEIDSAGAVQILTGAMSPLAVIEHRLGRRLPSVVERVRVLVGERRLRLISSRVGDPTRAKDNDEVHPLEPGTPAAATKQPGGAFPG